MAGRNEASALIEWFAWGDATERVHYKLLISVQRRTRSPARFSTLVDPCSFSRKAVAAEIAVRHGGRLCLRPGGA
jgi:hypothetical protein